MKPNRSCVQDIDLDVFQSFPGEHPDPRPRLPGPFFEGPPRLQRDVQRGAAGATHGHAVVLQRWGRERGRGWFCSLQHVVHIKGVPIPIGFVRHERRKDRSGTAHKAGTKLTGEERMVYCSM